MLSNKSYIGRQRRQIAAAFILVVFAPIDSVLADSKEHVLSSRSMTMTAEQLLILAEKAGQNGEIAQAEKAYQALTDDVLAKVRNEARFRLAMLKLSSKQYSAAAILLRAILDEQPNAQRVRLELAHVLDLLGDEAGARRALREVQAGGLPNDVARLVDRYSAALRSRKPVGASFEFALAPDTNINRSTRSDTLGTILGDFIIDDDAKQQSGVGVNLRGQFYARAPVSDKINIVSRINGGANLYGRDAYNDMSVAVTVGPEIAIGRDRLSFEAGVGLRWYGEALFSDSLQFGTSYSHPIDEKTLLRVNGSVTMINNRRNLLQDGDYYALSAIAERALSNSAGIAFTLSADRQDLRDRGYSATGGQASLFAYKEVGSTTLFASLGIGRSYADARLSLFPSRRKDKQFQASVGASFRQLRFWSLAPLARLTYERNLSSIEIYAYNKLRAEFGFTRAF